MARRETILLILFVFIYCVTVDSYELVCTRTIDDTCYIEDVNIQLTTDCVSQTFNSHVAFQNSTIIVDSPDCGFTISSYEHRITLTQSRIIAPAITISSDEFVLASTSALAVSVHGIGADPTQTGLAGAGGGHAGFGGTICGTTSEPAGQPFGGMGTNTPGGDARATDSETSQPIVLRGGGVLFLNITSSATISGALMADGDADLVHVPWVPVPTLNALAILRHARDTRVLSNASAWEHTGGLRGLLQWLRIAALHSDAALHSNVAFLSDHMSLHKDLDVLDDVNHVEGDIPEYSAMHRVPRAFADAMTEFSQLHLTLSENTGDDDNHDEMALRKHQEGIVYRALTQVHPTLPAYVSLASSTSAASADTDALFAVLSSPTLTFSPRLLYDTVYAPTPLGAPPTISRTTYTIINTAMSVDTLTSTSAEAHMTKQPLHRRPFTWLRRSFLPPPLPLLSRAHTHPLPSTHSSPQTECETRMHVEGAVVSEVTCVKANARTHAPAPFSIGGAAGGSILLSVVNAATNAVGPVVGGGTVTALGGTGGTSGGGGSGGRITVIGKVTDNAVKMRVMAQGGLGDKGSLLQTCRSGAGGLYTTMTAPATPYSVLCHGRMRPAPTPISGGVNAGSLSLTSCRLVTSQVTVTAAVELVDSTLASSTNIIVDESILEIRADSIALSQASTLSASVLGLTARDIVVDATSTIIISMFLEMDTQTFTLGGSARCMEDLDNCYMNMIVAKDANFYSSTMRASGIQIYADEVYASTSGFTATALHKSHRCTDTIAAPVCVPYHSSTISENTALFTSSHPSSSLSPSPHSSSSRSPWIGDVSHAAFVSLRSRVRTPPPDHGSTTATANVPNSLFSPFTLPRDGSPTSTLVITARTLAFDIENIVKGAVIGLCADDINFSGRVDANGLGCPSGFGTGTGLTTDTAGGGAGYGGRGGDVAVDSDVRTGGLPYAESGVPPNRMGSGGGESPTDPSSGGAGGGYIYVHGDISLSLFATISADGLQSRVGAGGGGSGGAVHLKTASFSSAMCTISAVGGDGYNGGGGGGGGVVFASWAEGGSIGGSGTKVEYHGGLGGALNSLLIPAHTSTLSVSLPSSSPPSATLYPDRLHAPAGQNGADGLVQTLPACIPGTAGLFCEACKPGTASEAKSMAACLPCAAGHYQPAEGQSFCFECQPGSSAAPGAEWCVKCDPGYFAPDAGMGVCSPCVPGQYSGKGYQSCDKCHPNTFSPGAASTCKACDVGYYSGWGESTCMRCDTPPAHGAFTGPGCAYDCEAGLVHPLCLPPFQNLSDRLGGMGALIATAIATVIAVIFAPFFCWCTCQKASPARSGVAMASVIADDDTDHAQMTYNSARVALRASDLPRHAYRLYLSGTNHYCDPLRLSLSVHPDLAPYVSEAPYARLAAQVNAACLWTPSEIRTYLILSIYYPLAMRYHLSVQQKKLVALADVIARSDNGFLSDPRAKALADSLRFGHSVCYTLAWVDVLHASVPTHALEQRNDGASGYGRGITSPSHGFSGSSPNIDTNSTYTTINNTNSNATNANGNGTSSVTISPSLTDFSSLRAGGLAGPALPLVLLCSGTGDFSAPFHLDCADPLVHALAAEFGPHWGALVTALNSRLRALPCHRVLSPRHLDPVMAIIAAINRAGALAATHGHPAASATDAYSADSRVVLSLGLIQPPSLRASRLARASHAPDTQGMRVSLLDDTMYDGYRSPTGDLLSRSHRDVSGDDEADAKSSSRGVVRLAIVAHRVSMHDGEWAASLEARAEAAAMRVVASDTDSGHLVLNADGGPGVVVVAQSYYSPASSDSEGDDNSVRDDSTDKHGRSRASSHLYGRTSLPATESWDTNVRTHVHTLIHTQTQPHADVSASARNGGAYNAKFNTSPITVNATGKGTAGGKGTGKGRLSRFSSADDDNNPRNSISHRTPTSFRTASALLRSTQTDSAWTSTPGSGSLPSASSLGVGSASSPVPMLMAGTSFDSTQGHLTTNAYADAGTEIGVSPQNAPRLFSSTARVFVSVDADAAASGQFSEYAKRLEQFEQRHNSDFDTQYDVVAGMYLPVHRNPNASTTTCVNASVGSNINTSMATSYSSLHHDAGGLHDSSFSLSSTLPTPARPTSAFTPAATRHDASLTAGASLSSLNRDPYPSLHGHTSLVNAAGASGGSVAASNGIVGGVASGSVVEWAYPPSTSLSIVPNTHTNAHADAPNLTAESLPYDCVPVSRLITLPDEHKPLLRYPWWLRIASTYLVHRPPYKQWGASVALTMVMMVLYVVCYLALNVVFAQLLNRWMHIMIFFSPPLIALLVPLLILITITTKTPVAGQTASVAAIFAFFNSVCILAIALYARFAIHRIKDDGVVLAGVLCILTLLLPLSLNALIAHLFYRHDAALCKPYQSRDTRMYQSSVPMLDNAFAINK